MSGYNDLKLVAPGLVTKLPREVEYLVELGDLCEQQRYACSVNAAYYGVHRHHIDEKKLGALGGVIKACHDELVVDSPLSESPAL